MSKRKAKKTKKERVSTFSCVKLDPEQFIAAWGKAQEMSDAENVVPLATKRPITLVDGDEVMSLQLTNNPVVRFLTGISASFSDQKEQQSCVVRIISIEHLAAKGVLGRFLDPEHGIWNDALGVLAVARCSMSGFDVNDVRKRLSKLEPPPV